jgi:hypothetical protein
MKNISVVFQFMTILQVFRTISCLRFSLTKRSPTFSIPKIQRVDKITQLNVNNDHMIENLNDSGISYLKNVMNSTLIQS